MQEKKLVTFRMAPKRSSGRGKKESAEPTITDGWKKSKLPESAIASLVAEGLLQSCDIVEWHSAEDHDRPYEKVAETVLFKSFVERGLALPACDFLQGLLYHWGIQLHHLTPNSIPYLHLCSPL